MLKQVTVKLVSRGESKCEGEIEAVLQIDPVGGSPTITKGKHAGSGIALDHVLPRSIVPELAARFFNLEALPAPENLAKAAKVGRRELDFARRWHREGLLSVQGLKAVEVAAKGAHYSRFFFMNSWAAVAVIAKLNRSLSKSFNPKVNTPTRRPFSSTTGPPLLPWFADTSS